MYVLTFAEGQGDTFKTCHAEHLNIDTINLVRKSEDERA